MKNIIVTFTAILCLGIFLTLQSCTSTSSSEEETIIAGEVVNQSTGNSIEKAIVEITAPSSLQQTATSDSVGHFSFSIKADSAFQITIVVSRQGFTDKTTSFKIAPGVDVDDLTVKLASESDSGGNDNSGGVAGESGGAAALTLTSLTSNSINVNETGGTVNTAFTFEVQDSAGRTVDHPVAVSFEVIRGPNGGESITPTNALTNSEGKVTSNLFAGDSSGTVRIQALIERPDVNLTIRSTPVLITIASGFPVLENFNVAPLVHNFDAYGYINENHTNNIVASIGDLKGNPVKEGTAVYFSASNGGLVSGSASTNANGYASVNLSANGSTPTGHPNGIGYIDVVAQTVDKDNNYIKNTTTLLLTTPRAVISVTPNVMDVISNGSQNFAVTITDFNGYPMAANTHISISTGEGLSASGDITDLQLGDFLQPGLGTTEFNVTISDSDSDHDDSTDGSFTITVEAPSGFTTTKTIQGTRAKVPN